MPDATESVRMKLLSVIIVNYNTRDLLRRCLAALSGREHPFPLETIVVDNASGDGSAAMVRSEFPDVRVVEGDQNGGFSWANNRGAEIATGDYILLLNSDTEVLDDALTKLVSFLDSHLDVAVVSGRLVYPDLSDQGVARAFPTPFNAVFGRTTLLARLFPNNRHSKEYIVSRAHHSDEPFEVDWVSGACLMVRSEVIEEVGFLDEGFFMYWEDADFCFRIKRAGWRVFCVPEARVIHHEGKSRRKKSSNRLIVEFNKSAYRYYRKHHVRSPFQPMNLVALLGLSLRTVVLLALNAVSDGDDRRSGENTVATSSDN
jgi:hypothetical protein